MKEIVGFWRDEAAEQLNHKGRELWVHPERSEWDQKRHNMAGQYKAFVSAKVGGSGEVTCSWQPDFNIEVSKDSMIVTVGRVSMAGELIMEDAKIQAAFGVSQQTLQAEFAAFKKARRNRAQN